MEDEKRRGALFIDEAHDHIREINDLIDGLTNQGLRSLVVILASARNHWKPRIKSPNIFSNGMRYVLAKIEPSEIERLLNLLDHSESLSSIVESQFAGFSRSEKKRRLVTRCHYDMFVCMRNIFASESFDDIILREYAGLHQDFREIYRLVSALETSGVKVHRQFVIRLLGIDMTAIANVLENTTDIVIEYGIDEKDHIYGWRGRHSVISSIIARYKYGDARQKIALFEKVIDAVLPSYDIEFKTLKGICNFETGIPSLADKSEQNRLFGKIISKVPSLRVARHCLIRNLIFIEQYDRAETEIRIYEKDFGFDPPISRLKIKLKYARAVHSEGLLPEDRDSILRQAESLALEAIDRHPNYIGVYKAYCEVGLEHLRLFGKCDVINNALISLEAVVDRLRDPEYNGLIAFFERQRAHLSTNTKIERLDSEIVED